ncbi:hypothetical protein Nepgr_009721 [Nepenthes gracilis]|uniref:Neurochondrin n=1 Tax=Nepenthes gracilis TaxID=150966 RepID=A0AAD3SBT5_NEPGR|nr:hypothetical protein Nepgr_009721 [Nepenthes gracilis]
MEGQQQQLLLQQKEEERQQQEQQLPTLLDDCLKLLRGERDEQRLAGLFLVTKVCNKEDHNSIRKVYDAVGVRFLDRLLRTGMRKENVSGGDDDNRDAYLQLSVTVLAAFCRVPEIAASEDMLLKIPSILQIMIKPSASSILEECYEFLLLVSTACEDGVTTLLEAGGMKVIALQIPSLSDGSHTLELSIRLVQLILSKISIDSVIKGYFTELPVVVASIARQFALSQNALKFELLHLLSNVLSLHHSVHLQNALGSVSNDRWSTYIRAGIVDILQNRVAPVQKMQALILAESLMTMLGEGWLLGQMNVPDIPNSIPPGRCLLLVLELSRVEVAILLNDLGYLKYEASSCNTEAISVKKGNLAIVFSLVEKIIKLISHAVEDEGNIICESTFAKVISGLNETIGVVLGYLKDGKDHGRRKGDDLLASVRVVGSYLAETPLACKEEVKKLLGYMLSVEGEDEQSPFLSACFLLPMLCQTTMKIEGATILASSGGYKAVVECLVKLICPGPHAVEDNSCIFLACDTILNLLLKREQIHVQLDESVFVPLLRAFAYWAEVADGASIMLASSICSLIFESTSEESLSRYTEFDDMVIDNLSRLVVKGLARRGQDMFDGAESDADLHEIISAGYSRWSNRFPRIRSAVEG